MFNLDYLKKNPFKNPFQMAHCEPKSSADGGVSVKKITGAVMEFSFLD